MDTFWGYVHGWYMKRISKVGKIGALTPTPHPQPLSHKGRGATFRVTAGGTRLLDTLPAELEEVEQRIGRSRAMAIWRLQRQGITGSVPELLTYDWLKGRPFDFEFQSAQMGGRMRAGGAVIDFLIRGLSANGLYVWRVMGEYWHASPEVQRKDEEQKRRLGRMTIGGAPVAAVVDLWEDDIYERTPEVFERAEGGEGLRGG